ncbi:hypothetical protein [Halorubellus sp. PRR65]|uniref:hypothetical protein n=1 Tax=Halorubellus sp. PRR65 TaxID=3098148 RepID=UPI002B25F506|nr:hypothetical protein [Halorubellus sp. PRR65]
MAAVGFAFLFVLFALVLPVALYWFVSAEDPDPRQTTSWNEAQDRASRDTFGGGRRDRDNRNARDDGNRDGRDHRGSREPDDGSGNHWD